MLWELYITHHASAQLTHHTFTATLITNSCTLRHFLPHTVGVSECIIMGIPATIGTGLFQLLFRWVGVHPAQHACVYLCVCMHASTVHYIVYIAIASMQGGRQNEVQSTVVFTCILS